MWSPQGWALVFRRSLNDWEVDRMMEFYKHLERFIDLQSGVDTLMWQGHKSGFYKANAAYKIPNQANMQINN